MDTDCPAECDGIAADPFPADPRLVTLFGDSYSLMQWCSRCGKAVCEGRDDAKADVAAALRDAGIDETLVRAFEETGYFFTEAILRDAEPDEIATWRAAVAAARDEAGRVPG